MHSNLEDIVSQLLMERLFLTHPVQPLLAVPRVPTIALSPPRGPSLAMSPTKSGGSVARFTGQPGREGKMAYLLDCYDRAVFEERYIKVLQEVTEWAKNPGKNYQENYK